MTHDELYKHDNMLMLHRVIGYAAIMSDHLRRYKNLNDLANKKSFLGKSTYANEAKQELEQLESLLKQMTFDVDFQIYVNNPLAKGEPLSNHGKELKARWDGNETTHN